MPDYLSPGVYIEEVPGPQPIVAVSTSIAGFLGMTERGPEQVPILCTSIGDYTNWFGGLLNHGDFLDPVDQTRSHCYLPYAVQGFFTNGGQLAYVVRVLPAEATYAHRFLYNRGNPGDLATLLLRTASEGTGTALLPPTICVVDATGVSSTTTLRIGDGSASEYIPVASAATLVDYVVTDQPLALSHAAGAAIHYSSITPGATPFSTASAANAGDTNIFVYSPVTNLAATPPTWIVIAGQGASDVAHVVGGSITALPNGVYSISLSLPLAQAHEAGTPADSFTLTALGNDTLLAAATGGDTVLLTTSAPPAGAALIDIEPTSTTTREARMLGQLTMLSIVQATSDDCPVNSLIAPVAFGAQIVSTTLTAGVGAGGRVISLASRTSVNIGTVLQLGTSPNVEYATVVAINGTRGFAPDPGSVVLATPLDFAYGNSSQVRVLPPPTTGAAPTTTTLAATANPTDSSVALTNLATVPVTIGSVLQIGTEYATVTALNSPAVGSVQLSPELQLSHASGATVDIFANPAINPMARLVFDAAAGSNSLIVTTGPGPVTLASGNLISITTPDNEVTYHTLAAAPVNAGAAGFTPALVTLSAPLQRNHPMGVPVVVREALFSVQALDKGSWGGRLWVSVQDEQPGLVSRAHVVSAAPPLQLTLTTLTGVEPGSYLELFNPTTLAAIDSSTPLKVRTIDRASATIRLDPPGLSGLQVSAISMAPANNPIGVRSREFSLTVMLYRQPDPAIPSRNNQILQSEVFRFLSMDHRHSHYIETMIGATDGPLALEDRRPKGRSMLIRVKDVASTPAAQEAPRLGPEPLVDPMAGGLTIPARFRLDQDGDDSMGTVTDGMYIGHDDPEPFNRTGIPALRNVSDISIVAVPGQGAIDIQAALIAHCESLLYRFAVLDPKGPDDSLADIQAQRQAFDTKYAAIYYPWLSIPDPYPANLSSIGPFALPPSGQVIGIYARVDDQRGVHKAPANEVVLGITDLTRKLYKGEQDILNPTPVNINVIRDFRADGRGIRVWGSRCITSDTDYTYVSTRRLLSFIEQSIDLGLQPVVFEPNAPALWGRVTRSVVNFLTEVWRSGALEGTRPQDAFFVQCGVPQTMTQDDIDNGRLIVIIGVAPVKPAEFVIIRIGLTAAKFGQ